MVRNADGPTSTHFDGSPMTLFEIASATITSIRIEATRSSVALAFIGIIVAVCCLATGGIFVKLSALDPIATGAWRIGLALPIAYAWQALERRRDHAPEHARDARQILLLWLAGACLGLDLALWNVSFHYTTVANANLLANLVPFVVVPVAWLVYRETISRLFVAGFAIALCGVTILLSPKLGASSGALFGDALALMTALFYGSYLLLVSGLRRTISSGRIMYLTSFGSLSILVPLALLFEHRLFPVRLSDLWPLIGLALLAHLGGQGLLAACLRYIPAGLSSVLVLMQPVVAALYAWMLFGESLGPVELLGVAVCLTGIYVAKLGQR
ncbi:drug/metabolite transporter (DMT)-like permease [Rhodopseudomonas thermotolerans]|uniref:Drug/metabolite transporter (DMT)-like permease n=3 Tax=Nitrobacteraceae TaxID=41294 RepID=A0A336JNQ1_9BRAD|nr:drug/metabolite transporter (DMT)-like permease [Rhodopseudomonas pentothenatexigens]REG03923.1 drug/metabolite transporter (DMT)-like permease [Rhodopseudomonas thermotolerans]SSW90403.1 drug/metabolite transporter (DMT)-like permease [Rhodopseudomonas pentothenatexigens]